MKLFRPGAAPGVASIEINFLKRNHPLEDEEERQCSRHPGPKDFYQLQQT